MSRRAHLCSTTDVFSFHCNIWHRILAPETQVFLAEHDNVIHTLATDRSD
jgi:hypothetical protein